ncbi:MAG: type II toxin-antitoxin system HigB family toxin [Pigmentiphaga sp.]|nr:type II toxin-antitoxin system HigB family toxin [Pigmentiphaga sp.]
MHVIAKPILVAFWAQHPAATSALQAWYRLMTSHDFHDFHNLRNTFASADLVDGLTVFNLGGNKYRLIASIHYNRRKVYVRQILTHTEYDHGKWKTRRR